MSEDEIFILQLITSFIVWWGFIAILSLLAERASEKVAWIIISLPSTVVISFIFIWLVLWPDTIWEIAPVLPITSWVIMLFTATYLYASRIKMKKIYSIIFSSIISLTVWLLLAIPLAIYEFSNLYLSLAWYALLTLIAYYFITIKPKIRSNHVSLHYSTRQKITRAIIEWFFIMISVLLAKALWPVWWWVFSWFPAVFIASLTIIYWHYDSDFIFKVWKNSPLWSIVFVSYSMFAMYTFPAFWIILWTLFAYFWSLCIFLLIKKLN